MHENERQIFNSLTFMPFILTIAERTCSKKHNSLKHFREILRTKMPWLKAGLNKAPGMPGDSRRADFFYVLLFKDESKGGLPKTSPVK